MDPLPLELDPHRVGVDPDIEIRATHGGFRRPMRRVPDPRDLAALVVLSNSRFAKSPCSRRSSISLSRDVVPMFGVFGVFAVAVTPPYRARSSLFITDGIDTKTPAGRFFFHVMASLAPDGARADPGAHPRWPRGRPVRRTRRGPKAPDDRRQGSGRPKAIGKRDAAQRGGAQLRPVGSAVISMGASLFADVRARARASRFGHCQYDRHSFETIHFVTSIFWQNVSRSCQILINFGRAYPSPATKGYASCHSQ